MEYAKLVLILKYLATKGAISGAVSLSSRDFGKEIGISQQSASNWIIKLASEGYIERQLGARTQIIKLSSKGIDVLKKEFTDYQNIFEAPGQVKIRGTVATGFGEGGYYITQKGYVKQFMKKLNINPYQGTLNIKLSPHESRSLEFLKNSDGITVQGFKKEGRTFGAVKCFLAKINNVECAIVIPKRSHYKDVVEVISKVHLRRTLSLKDGDEVELSVIM